MPVKQKTKGRWAFKTTRSVPGRVVNVGPIIPAPPNVEPYRLKYHDIEGHQYAESLQVFTTRHKATVARDAELVASEFSRMTTEQIHDILIADLKAAKADLHLSLSALCAIGFIPRWSVEESLRGVWNIRPRTAAKLHYVIQTLLQQQEKFRNALTEAGDCGNANMDRKHLPFGHYNSPTRMAERVGNPSSPDSEDTAPDPEEGCMPAPPADDEL